MRVDRFDLDVSYFSVSVPVLFFLAAVDFLLRMDFVMLVLVLSLLCFILWPDQRAKGRGPGVVVVVL